MTNGTTTNEIADLARVAYSEGKGFVSPIAEVLDDLRNGRMVILVDAEDRENEGDLVIPAQMATPEAINFMARFGVDLIPHTLTVTTWGRKKPGDLVNIEIDPLARYVARLLEMRR